MEKIKVSSLGIFDEQRFKKISDDRETWIKTGKDVLINNSYEANQLADEMMRDSSSVVVKRIIQENENYKTFILSSTYGTALPIFKAGQKVALTVNVDGNYYTRPYYLTCSPSRSFSGEYAITIKKNESDDVAYYLFNNVKLEEKFSVSRPFGNFYYDSIRDEKNVILIVTNEGILPAYSMVQSIIDGTDNYNLFVYYCFKNDAEVIFKDELTQYSEKSNKVKVEFISDAHDKFGNRCLITGDMIKPRYEEGYTSFFIAGSEELLHTLNEELKAFNLPKRFIRYDVYLPSCNIRKTIKYNLTINVNDEKIIISCYNNKTILKAIEEGGIFIPSRCQNGSCGLCQSELVSGDVKIINDKRSKADKKYNFIHPCCTYPLSDIEIIVR